MNMNNTSSNTLCSRVVDYVIEQVANKTYNVGDKLPTERDLSTQLEVSRVTVREAMKVLNYLGFVDSTQGSGNYITSTYDKTTSNIMRVMYLRGEVEFSDFTAFRQMLELQSFDLAIKNITREQLTEMEQIVMLLDFTTDKDLIFNLDNRLHTLLAEASHNSLIIINFHALTGVINEYMKDTYHQTVNRKVDGFNKLQSYHHAIVDALSRGDKLKGHQAIKDHFALLR